MDFSFFLIDNKSGYKTKEKWFSKNYPEIYNEIINYSNNLNLDQSFKEKIYFYFNKITERPKCLTCNNEIKFRERFDIPFGEFCSIDCINNNKEEMTKRISKTNKEKYGVDFYPQHKDFNKKQKKTKKELYGDENYNNIEKLKQTKKELYGDENYNNIEKSKKTNLKKYGVDNYTKSKHFKNKIIKKFISNYPNIIFKKVHKYDVEIYCEKCNDVSKLSKQLLYERNKRNYEVCTNCNPIGNSFRSGLEIELCSYLDELNIEYETNIKINNIEIDILIPKYNIGIEFNGLYWHSEIFKSSDFHLNKTNIVKNNNISLIHIFEDEWIYKKDIIKSIISNRLGLSNEKIYARKCEIKEIKPKETKKFLEDNHIQGNVNSSIRLGLFYNDDLISVMTFSKGRVIMGGKSNEYELNRYCSKLNTNVVGSASKLLKYFIKKYKPKTLISYSDIRMFDGKLYEKLGFQYKQQSKPNYWYIINDKRYHRFNFRKSILVKEGYDKNKTEHEIMFERKIYRIYDCGNIRWEMNF